MKRKNTDGNIILPIIIIIVLLVIGALGYIFWTNSQQAQDTAVQTSETIQHQETTDTTSLQESTLDATFPVSVSWQYPADWTITSKGPTESGGVTMQTVTLTSPTGAYSVVYRGGMGGGIGGTCAPDIAGILQHVSKQATDSFKDAVFAEFIYDTYSIADGERTFEGYEYIAGLFKNDAAIQATSVGDSYCTIYLKNTFFLQNSNGTMLFEAGININSSSATTPLDNVTAITTAFDNTEYHEAVKILLSTSVKK